MITRMMLQYFVTQATAVDVNINLGGGDALVAEHLLDGSQVGPAFKQMGGKTVAQGVGADRLAHASQFAQLLDDVEDHLARKHRPAAVQEQDILTASLHCLAGARLLQIEGDLLDGHGRDGHQPLLVALALDDDIALVEIELR